MDAILGLGLDLIDLEHFAMHYGSDDPDLLGRCFTPGELEAVGDGIDRLARLAGRFEVKEAVFKALGGSADISHLDIETISDSEGAPQLRLSGPAQELAAARGVGRWFVSISHSASSTV